MIARVMLMAGNTLRATLDKRALYLWGAAIVVMLFSAAPVLFAEGDDVMVAVLRAGAIVNALQNLGRFCVAAAIFVGAGSMAADIASKTLITVLARPVARWEILVGKWLGLTAFGTVTLLGGTALGIVIALWAGVAIDGGALALAAAHTIVAIALFGAAAVSLSAVSTSGLAGSIPVLILFAPAMVAMLQSGGPGAGLIAGRALEAATPPGLEEQYARAPQLSDAALQRSPALRRARESYDPSAQPGLLAENLAFTALYLLGGCALFVRRDINV